jgi:hypothetical protein
MQGLPPRFPGSKVMRSIINSRVQQIKVFGTVKSWRMKTPVLKTSIQRLFTMKPTRYES